MELFDLHCDTIVGLRKRGEDLCVSSTQFSLREKAAFQRMCQTMAVFVPDTCRGEAAKAYVDVHAEYLRRLLQKQETEAGFAQSASDVERLNREGRAALLLSIESGAALAGEEENVAYFARKGVRMMSLVWNGENELASGSETEHGMSAFGRRAVRRMEREGMLVDVSHLNDRGFEDLCEIAEKPFLATHSNLRSVCGHRRNLTEAQFGELVRRGGLCGLNLHRFFLSEDGCGTKEALFRHLYRMLELGGEDAIACGSDFDGADIDASLDSPHKFARTAEYFSEQGISDAVIHKIFYENALEFFRGQCG